MMKAAEVDWDRQIKNLQEIFHELDKRDRNARDRRRRDTQEKPKVIIVSKRCERCKKFCKDKLCARCAG